MNDRELLEPAAKAAGIYRDALDCEWYDCNGDVRPDWNPLIDDGDALRLAVKLGYQHMIGTWIGCYVQKGEYEQDPYAATRRAIVRAAAEIGKGMK